MKHHIRLSIVVIALIAVSGCEGFLIPSHHNSEDYKPVFAAAENGNLAEVKKAIANDPAIVNNAMDWDNTRLLHDAVKYNRINIVKLLLKSNADVNVVDKYKVTPLHIAAKNGNIEIMKLLVNKGANVKATDFKGRTPLDWATKWKKPDAVEFLRNSIPLTKN